MERIVKNPKEEFPFSIFHPDTLASFQPLKKTDNRLILKGHLDNQKKIIIKIFQRPHFSDYLKYFFRPSRSRKEWRIGQELMKFNIPIPPLLAYKMTRRYGVLTKDIIVSREISGAEPLNEWAQENFIQSPLPLSEKKVFLHDLGLFVRKVHDQGVFSQDFHQGNILIQAERGKPPLIYLIDFHSIQIKKQLTIRDRIENLAQFNNFKIPVTDRLRFLNAYLQGGLKGIARKDLVREIGLASLSHWKRLWKKRKERCLRPGKGLEDFERGHWRGLIRKGYDAEKIFLLLDTISSAVTGVRTQEMEAPVPGLSKDLAMRYVKISGFLSPVKAFFQLSRARQAWITIHNLIMRGIPTLEPVAWGERKKWGLLKDWFFIFKNIPEAVTSDIFLKKLSENSLTPGTARLKEEFLQRLARLIRWMHQTGMYHRDLKPDDILVSIHHEKPFLWLVDCDGVKIGKRMGLYEIANDLTFMQKACPRTLSASDQNFFLARYGRGNNFFKRHEKRIVSKVQQRSMKKS